VNILVVNCGSSSLGFKVYKTMGSDGWNMIIAGKARNVATQTQAQPRIAWSQDGSEQVRECPLPTHQAAAREMLGILKENDIRIDAIGHRFVHGGELFKAATRVDARSLDGLKQVLPLAPIHNPNSFSVIQTCLEELPNVPEFVVFDTAFHASLPVEARTYALPRDLAEHYGLRKYGFHGLSYQYISVRAAALLNQPLEQVKLIMCHLGTGGSSVCAFANGHSEETSMGFSPLAGLVMSTRCGDIDAEVALELVRQGMPADEVSRVLNNQSGLIGLSGYSSNLSEIIQAAEAGNEACRIAYEVYARRLKHYLGAYTYLLNGADAIVFTDDIGVTSWKLREKVCSGADQLGIRLDAGLNRRATDYHPAFIQNMQSSVKILVLPTDEEQVIMEEVLHML